MLLPGARSRYLLPALLLPALTACALTASQPAPGPTGQLVTREQIEAARVSTAWEVLRHFAHHLRFGEHANGTPSQASRRGRASVHLREDPLLVLDGVRMRDLRLLAALPARDIESVRIFSALEATSRFGVAAAGGAVIIATRRPQD